MFSIVNINNWSYLDIHVSGSKEKRWYRDPMNNKLHLFKIPVSLTSSKWKIKNESTGEMWSEKITSEIGKKLHLDIHDVEVGVIDLNTEIITHLGVDPIKVLDGKVYGALCSSFLSEGLESLIEGADMIMDFDTTYDRDTLKGEVEIYSYDLLYRVFTAYNCVTELFKMVIFDTLIGNTDRHQDNFGVVRDEVTGILRFSPLYDNSSCLGRELPESNMILMLRDNQMFNAYLFGRKSSSLIKWGNVNSFEKLSSFELLKRIVSSTPAIKKYFNMLDLISDEDIDYIVFNIPNVVMSDVKKTFVSKVLKTRRDFILKEI
ncbi:HipA domain-containing protein [Paenibacillus amylolyticus]|uniref:HipA domain-containing protein n=1 Tax=Paenibacillus amylolyticus TaxID=1451 RepID=UPI00201DEBB4|nr:HipA domain-containing protein [Paenibacillus amylolyticus]MCL6663370.1 HipA domain-containing protein [Paenibacillus amylolyticus]